MNKIYLYKHNFGERGEDDEDAAYDKEGSRLRLKCQKLFKEDELGGLPTKLTEEWQKGPEPRDPKDYSRDLCVERFRFNQDKYAG